MEGGGTVVDLDATPQQNEHTNGGSHAAENGKPHYDDADAVKKPKDGEDGEAEEELDLGPESSRHRLSALLHYASKKERLMFVVACIATAIGAGAWPLWALFFGQAIGAFDPDEESVADTMDDLAIIFVVTGAVVGIGRFLHAWLFRKFGSRMATRIRYLFVRSVMRQEPAWHDKHPSSALDVRINSLIPKLQAACSVTLEDAFLRTFETVWGLAIGFYASWQLTLVFIAFSPIMIASFGFFFSYISGFEVKQSKMYEDAGVVANEALHLIRTVMSFGTYDREFARYDARVTKARDAGTRAGHVVGFAFGLPDFAIFAQYALAFWYGGKLSREGEIEPEDIMIALFATMIGLVGFGQAMNQWQKVLSSLTTASSIFNVIERNPEIDNLDTRGEQPEAVRGAVEFRNVKFAYPSKPDEVVLPDFNLTISPGESVALCGSSGSGKSTIISLLERFYDPTEGSITIDGIPMKDINVQTLRKHIGLVTQTPVLFPGTIFENIAIGKEGATKEEVVAAARAANAHDFISAFPDKYQTAVGDLGSQLSGGQRQRISIARVLVSNPSMLLLDEATSALDNTSEAVVQQAIDNASTGRTVVTVAHRLSTIRNANRILVLEKGCIVEQGSHQELVARKGVYFNLLQEQGAQSEENVAETAGQRRESGAIQEAAAASTTAEDLDEVKSEKAPESETGSQMDPRALRWAWGQSKADAGNIFLCLFAGFLAGLNWPAASIILAESVNAVLFDEGADTIRNWSIAFLVLAFYNLISHYARVAFSFIAGEKLTYRLRRDLFHRMLHQDASWFDQNPRDVSTRIIASDAGRVRWLVSDYWSIMVLVFVTIVGGLVVGLVYCWQVTLVLIATMPALIAGTVLEMRIMQQTETAGSKQFEESSTFASFLISNVKLLASLSQCETQIAIYEKHMETAQLGMKKASIQIGVGWGVADLLKFCAFGLAFWFAGKAVDDGMCTFNESMKALVGVLFCGLLAGIYGAHVPSYTEGKKATTNVLKVYNSFTDDDLTDKPKVELNNAGIEFDNVVFAYPTRPDTSVVNGLSLKVNHGETVALVGSSGSGKSTLLALTQGLYFPASGTVRVGGHDITAVDVDSLRRGIASVDQQPRLFSTTIRENIAYSAPDGEQVTEERIREAAKAANALDFIEDFEDKFETDVGEFGERLSGGQRQRVSIARALLRDKQVKILLLDEATSALDTVNERKVQQAIENARDGRTTLIVAHRLSTIQNADRIAVIDQGVVVEQGTHNELLAANGVYAGLYSSQFAAQDTEAGNK